MYTGNRHQPGRGQLVNGSSSTPDPFEPSRLGPLTLRNRLIKCATFEGATPDALVTDDLVEFHREVAAGGVAMSTVAYLSLIHI